ncbi:histone-lysine N-methyltransferase PRDM9-like [Oppia nitens]|uniref:histone-lysine N-methyltransferase PRDM9-like n=1 Tax=Oppia nitens TaxID=1686743 RepID=UPI0023DA45C6|nr:histone-lysine N-methyltransferase PRDM9-like [Oppia nitens]
MLSITAKSITKTDPIVCVEVNDIFDDLMSENKRLVNELLFANNCLNLLNELKSYLQIIHAKYKTMIAEEDVKQWQTLQQSVDTTVDEYNRLKSQVNQESNSGQRLQTSVKTSFTSCSTAVPQPIANSEILRLLQSSIPTANVQRVRPLGRPDKDCDKQLNNRNVLTQQESTDQLSPERSHTSRKTFSDNCELTAHLKTHHDDTNCEKLTDSTDDGSDVDVDDDVVGDVDDDDHQSNESLLLMLEQNNFDDKQQRYLCPFTGCDRKYVHKKDLKVHFLQHHFRPDDRPYVCQVCGQSYKRNYLLEKHMIVHDLDKQKTYQCSEHVLTKHSTVKNTYKCDIDGCNEIFENLDKRRHHRQFVHNIKYLAKTRLLSPKLRECQWPDCDYRCSSNDNMENHIRKHTGERPFVCQWPQCDKRYKTKFRLRYHEKRSHQNLKPESKFVCQWPGCEYRNSSSYKLNEHTRLHTGELPYVCQWPECGKRFRLKLVLTKHEICHKNLKPFVCHWPGCEYRGNSSGNYYAHKKIHLRQQ